MNITIEMTATEYTEYRTAEAAKGHKIPCLQTLRNKGLAYPIAAEEKYVLDEDNYPIKVWRYFYLITL